MAGLRYIDMPAGDYVQDPPVGFWPEYLRAIVARLNKHYGLGEKGRVGYDGFVHDSVFLLQRKGSH